MKGDAELVGREIGREGRRLEGVDIDAAVAVALPLDRSAMDRLVARRPDRERVPLRLSRSAARAHLYVEPRSSRRCRVPGRDELVERERRPHRGGRPRTTLIGDRPAVGVDVAALRGRRAELQVFVAGHSSIVRAGIEGDPHKAAGWPTSSRCRLGRRRRDRWCRADRGGRRLTRRGRRRRGGWAT